MNALLFMTFMLVLNIAAILLVTSVQMYYFQPFFSSSVLSALTWTALSVREYIGPPGGIIHVSSEMHMTHMIAMYGEFLANRSGVNKVLLFLEMVVSLCIPIHAQYAMSLLNHAHHV